MLLIGVDVGGTKVKIGIIRDGEILKKIALQTNTFDIVRQIVNGVYEVIQSIGLTIEDVDGIGVGFPGMVVNNIVVDSPNIGLKNFNLQEFLTNEFGKPVIVKNDAEMATLSEHKFGAGNDCDNMVLVTLGTGVGGGIIVNDNLYTGAGGAGEFGHMTLEKNGRQCSCGRLGCAEQYVSLSALDRLAKEMKQKYQNSIMIEDAEKHISASEIMRAYKKNDLAAMETVNKFVYDLSSFLMDLCNIFRPNKIIVGGGICLVPEIISMADGSLKTLTNSFQNAPKVDVVPARLGNDAGMLGAAVCFKDFEFPVKEERVEENSESESFASGIAEEWVDDRENPVVPEEVLTESEENLDNIRELFGINSETEEEASVSEQELVAETVADAPNDIQTPLQEIESVNEEHEYIEPQYKSDYSLVDDDYDEFVNYKPLEVGSIETDREKMKNLLDVEDENLQEDQSEEYDGGYEDLDNIEYSDELLNKINTLLKNK